MKFFLKNQTEIHCAKCGACAPVCPVFQVEGRESLTARGRMHLLSALTGQASAQLADIFSHCLLCGACEQVCSRQLPIKQIVVQARSNLPQHVSLHRLQQTTACIALEKPVLLEGLIKTGISIQRIFSLPQDSGLRLKLALLEERSTANTVPFEPSTPLAQSNCSYFTGCFARHLQPSIATATIQLLEKCTLIPYLPTEQACCGLAAWSAGRLEQARALAQQNIEAFAATKGPIITSCASCSAHLLAYPDLFAANDTWQERAKAFAARVREFTQFFNKYLPDPPTSCNKLRVFYHDPCHLRFQKNGMTAPRQLLKKTDCSLVKPENGPHCCGLGGLFHLTHHETSAKIFARSSLDALTMNSDYITSTCSGCLMQYQQKTIGQNIKSKIIHLAILLKKYT